MQRVNLKELKEALEQIPDELLQYFYAHNKLDAAFEDPEPETGIIFIAEEEQHETLQGVLDNKKMKVIHDFVKGIIEAERECVAAKLSEEVAEHLGERESYW